MSRDHFSTADWRPLGSTDMAVSPLGLGTVKLGRNQGVKYPKEFVLPTDTEIVRLLGVARDLGINLIDTAPAYGQSEERLGRLLAGDRDRWIIGTKVGETFSDNQSRWDFSAEGARASIEQSLKQLRTDYLDYVLVHSNGDDEAIINHTDILAALAALRDAGTIRAFGVSTKTVEGGLLAAAMTDIVMVTYNLAHTEEGPVIDSAHALHKGVLVKKALDSGHARDPDASLRFVTSTPGVSSVIVGTINEDHLRGNVGAALSGKQP